MGKVKNQFYKDFLDGFLLNEISRQDINLVLNNIEHEEKEQARALVIIAWATGARPNEYLRLTPQEFSRSTEFLEIKFPASKGSSARTISMPRYLKDGTEDPLTTELYDYVRSLHPSQWLFWFFRSDAVQHGVTKRYIKKDGTPVVKRYDKVYSHLSSKLHYYFPKWFKILFPDGVPPYYLRHNRATKVLEVAGREATIETFGWKTEHTLKKYAHKTRKMRRQIAEGLMK